MHGPHHLARQRAVSGGPQLEQREGKGDPEGRLAGQTGAESGGQPLDRFLGRMRCVVAWHGRIGHHSSERNCPALTCVQAAVQP